MLLLSLLYLVRHVLGHEAVELAELTLHSAHSVAGLLAVYAYILVNAVACWIFRSNGEQDPSEL